MFLLKPPFRCLCLTERARWMTAERTNRNADSIRFALYSGGAAGLLFNQLSKVGICFIDWLSTNFRLIKVNMLRLRCVQVALGKRFGG